MSRRTSTRRTFLKTTAALAAAPPFVRPSALGANAPSERVTVGFIGTGNQGMNLLRKTLALPEARVVAVCDVNRGSYGYKEDDHFYGCEPAQKLVNETYGRQKPQRPDRPRRDRPRQREPLPHRQHRDPPVRRDG
jgi:hypothetical protein